MKTTVINKIESRRFVYDHAIMEGARPEDFPSHIHESYEILFFLRGSISYMVEGKSYKLRRGDLVFTRPSVFHNVHPTGGGVYERYNVVFDEKMVPEGVRKRIPKDVDVFNFRDLPRMYDIFAKIDEYSKSVLGEELVRITRSLIEEVFYNLATAETGISGHTSANPLVMKAVEYIHENLTTVSGIEEICDALYITKSHLHHLFSANIGVSPKQYITSKRLLLAQGYIRRGEKPTAVAGLCGFDDYATFFRNYKRHFGYSPSEENDSKSKKEINA